MKPDSRRIPNGAQAYEGGMVSPKAKKSRPNAVALSVLGFPGETPDLAPLTFVGPALSVSPGLPFPFTLSGGRFPAGHAVR